MLPLNTLDDASNTNLRQIEINILHKTYNRSLNTLDGPPNKLDLSCNDDAIPLVAFGLQNNLTLLELDISSNCLSMNGVTTVCDSLKQNCTLVKLTVRLPTSNSDSNTFVMRIITDSEMCDVSNRNVCDTGARLVAAMLHNNCKVTKLDISKNKFSDDGVQAICDYLAHKKQKCMLQDLNMSYNRITKQGAESMNKAFQTNETLYKLNISYCEISTKEALTISESFKSHEALKELILTWRNESSLIYINTAVSNLDISHKNIGSYGAIIISNVLHNNVKVQKLIISHNNISDDGAVDICNLLKNNNTLELLDISCNGITRQVQEMINIAAQFNHLTIVCNYNTIKQKLLLLCLVLVCFICFIYLLYFNPLNVSQLLFLYLL